MKTIKERFEEFWMTPLGLCEDKEIHNRQEV